LTVFFSTFVPTIKRRGILKKKGGKGKKEKEGEKGRNRLKFLAFPSAWGKATRKGRRTAGE